MPDKTNALHDAHVRTWCLALRRFSKVYYHAHARARHNESLHDAHVRAKISWMSRAQDDASRAEAQANAWRDNVENSPSNTTDTAQHAYDFTEAIRSTTFFKTHPNQQLAMQIDAALNEYHDLRNAREQRTEQEKAAREKAQALIEKLRCTFEEIAKNSLARAAVLEAFCHPDKPAELDERIASLSRAVESLEEPRAVAGRPKTPELDRLISRIADIVVRAREQTIRDEEEKPDARATELAIMRRAKTIKRNDKIGRAYTEELLAAGRVVRAGSTLDNKLANITHHQQIAAEQRVEINHLPASIIAPDS